MRPELNLKDKSQMSTPNEYSDNFKSNLICTFLSVWTKLKKTLCPRTQCRNGFWKNFGCDFFISSSHSIMLWYSQSSPLGSNEASWVGIKTLFSNAQKILCGILLLYKHTVICRRHRLWRVNWPHCSHWGYMSYNTKKADLEFSFDLFISKNRLLISF